MQGAPINYDDKNSKECGSGYSNQPPEYLCHARKEIKVIEPYSDFNSLNYLHIVIT
ncbi:MAG: hypothetical protein WBF33_17380 [Candidatus Nitrosopolaris sp.]